VEATLLQLPSERATSPLQVSGIGSTTPREGVFGRLALFPPQPEPAQVPL
jgi:hypothetical protein